MVQSVGPKYFPRAFGFQECPSCLAEIHSQQRQMLSMNEITPRHLLHLSFSYRNPGSEQDISSDDLT